MLDFINSDDLALAFLCYGFSQKTVIDSESINCNAHCIPCIALKTQVQKFVCFCLAQRGTVWPELGSETVQSLSRLDKVRTRLKVARLRYLAGPNIIASPAMNTMTSPTALQLITKVDP